MSLSAATVPLLILLLISIVSTVSGAQRLTFTPEDGTTINIRGNQVKGCKVCTGSGQARKCNTSLNSLKGHTVSVEFECSRPEDVFSISFVRHIECTTKSCSGHIVQADSSSVNLLRFNRTFTWKLKASEPKAFKIDFTKTGLKQISPSGKCPDRHTYTLQAFAGNVTVGKYCRIGTISSVQILKQGSFSVDVPAGQKLQNDKFNVTVGDEIKSFAQISLTLPKGTSSSELLSPNYPESFPDDNLMEWHFQVPDKHRAAVQFLNLTQTDCVKKEAAVEYRRNGREASVLRLMDTQPPQNQGDFLLTLRNCKMGKLAGTPGLSFNLEVSAYRPDSTVCKVDVSRMEGLSLHISKLRPTPDCVMKMNSLEKEDITVTSSANLSFEGCLPDDLQITATQVIDCSLLKCPTAPVQLLVPLLPSCLPTPLSRVMWTLRPNQHGTVKLTSPTGPLKQSLPGQLCNDSVRIEVAEEKGTTIGSFCPDGAIQTVHIHTSVSITWRSSMDANALRMYYKHVLNASFEKEIAERYIFTVSPKRDTPALVATPRWPAGMKSYSTVSWIVSVPPMMDAHLTFTNLTQPKCSNRHTNIRVQRVGSLEEDYSRREDEKAESELTVSENFYLNMSNCLPERGNFSVITKITLQKSKNLLLTSILSVVASLLVIVVLVVSCVVIWKKKNNQLNHDVSVYNPNGINIPPRNNRSPKIHEDDESNVYTSIDDTLVYTHLLTKGAEVGIYGETCQPFPGHTDSQKAPPLPVRPPNQIQTLVNNTIYQPEDQSEDEQPPNLGPRLEPEGGN
ncbi:CUB domain-containing protein 1a isoform X1 [Archocentrus centrarchus]|uniref:CUB domain-containing protein 1a isoform X1 n=1 Tax=Archocentrus centrarchus TaxID=63155 RepID=UPI0011EA40DC|nr:CUB domain-containing protein 1 isoform X1 [Archocentrus centrarchus]